MYLFNQVQGAKLRVLELQKTETDKQLQGTV